MSFRVLFAMTMLSVCAACAQAGQKATFQNQSIYNEVLVGRKAEPFNLSELQQKLKLLPLCFDRDLKAKGGFSLQIVKGELILSKGALVDATESLQCLKRNSYLSSLESYWIWTPNFSIPDGVRKNWISLVAVKYPVKTLEKGKSR